MRKLKFTDTARVLHAALGADTFTVEELAKRTAVKVATVRTALFRSQSLLEEVATADTRRAGRRSKRYRLSDAARKTLSEELAELTAGLRPRDASQDTLPNIDSALAAAKSSLELAQEKPEEGGDEAEAMSPRDWLARARLQLDAARRLVPGIHDSAQRQRVAAELLEIEAAVHQLQTPSMAEWHKQIDEFALQFAAADSAPRPAAAERIAHARAVQSTHEVPCLWFDATDARHDPWSQDIARSLASCRPYHFPIHDLLGGSQGSLTELNAVIAGMPSESLIFLTKRSHQAVAGREAMQLLSGPLHTILQPMDQNWMGPAPTITVMDHDLNQESFWINHRIANLRYYPTAPPDLARLIAEKLTMDMNSSSPVSEGAPRSGGSINSRSASWHSEARHPVLASGERLSRAASDLGFAELELYLQGLAASNPGPVCLLGVNRGGYLLAKLLWERRGGYPRSLVKCDYHPDSGKLRLQGEIPPELSSFVIIDDVVRTGRTMSAVRTYLRDRYPSVKHYAIALAAVSAGYRGTGIPYDIDFCIWISRNPALKFPWSDAADKEPNPALYLDPAGVNQVGGWLTEHVAHGSIADWI
jgi:hypoxanthine phosphoribosyltransferase